MLRNFVKICIFGSLLVSNVPEIQCQFESMVGATSGGMSQGADSNPMTKAGMDAAMKTGDVGGQSFTVAANQVGMNVFVRHPGIDKKILEEIALMVDPSMKDKVLDSKLELIEGSQIDKTFPAGQYHFFKVRVVGMSNSIYHCKVQHIAPSDYKLTKVIGPLEESVPVSPEEFDPK